MSPIVASAIALCICAVFIFPALWMSVRPSGSRLLAPFSVAAIVGLALLQTGTFDRSSLASIDKAVPSDGDRSRCTQIMSLLGQNSVLLQPVGPEGLVVRGELWDQFPQPVKQAVLECARRLTHRDDAADVKVTKR